MEQWLFMPVMSMIRTLVLIKPENVQKVLMKLNSFHKSLNFTFDSFPDAVHFLDIKIEKNKTDIYRKDTHTGQYVHFTSFEHLLRTYMMFYMSVPPPFCFCSPKGTIMKIRSILTCIMLSLPLYLNTHTGQYVHFTSFEHLLRAYMMFYMSVPPPFCFCSPKGTIMKIRSILTCIMLSLSLYLNCKTFRCVYCFL